MRRPLVLAIDVEPDGRAVLDPEHGWTGSVSALEHLVRLRGALERATRERVRFNWFLRADPQIAATWGRADWVAEACPGIIQAIQANDDFAGIHVHAWRFSAERQSWFSDFKDSAWVEECVSTSADAFTTIFGQRPVANRFGDRWMSEDAVAIVRKLGMRFDLTVEPGLPALPVHDDRHATHWFPDFRGVPRGPYVPLGNNFRVASPAPAADDLWMLPVTTSAASFRVTRRLPFIVRTSQSPNLVLDHPSVWSGIRASLDEPERNPVVVVMRSGDLSQPGYLANFLSTTESLAQHPAMPLCEFVSAEEAIARWRAGAQ